MNSPTDHPRPQTAPIPPADHQLLRERDDAELKLGRLREALGAHRPEALYLTDYDRMLLDRFRMTGTLTDRQRQLLTEIVDVWLGERPHRRAITDQHRELFQVLGLEWGA